MAATMAKSQNNTGKNIGYVQYHRKCCYMTAPTNKVNC